MLFATVIITFVVSLISLIIWGCGNGDNYWEAHWKTQFSLTQWAILGWGFFFFFFRIGGKSHQRKHRRQWRSPPGRPSPPPVTLQSNATAASGTIRKEITDRTGKQLRSLRAKNKSWTAARPSEWKDDPNSPPPKLERIFTVLLNSYFAVNDAERTACPRRDRSKQPKANTGRMTPRGRGKGSIFRPFLTEASGFQVYLTFNVNCRLHNPPPPEPHVRSLTPRKFQLWCDPTRVTWGQRPDSSPPPLSVGLKCRREQFRRPW